LNSFDDILVCVFAIVQWRIAVLLLRAAGRRFSGRWRTLA
jgi:hypothetical protein